VRVASTRTISSPLDDDTSAPDVIAVDSDDTSPSVLPQNLGDDLGMRYVAKFRWSSFLSSSRVPVPVLSSASLQDGWYQPDGVYHSELPGASITSLRAIKPL